MAPRARAAPRRVIEPDRSHVRRNFAICVVKQLLWAGVLRLPAILPARPWQWLFFARPFLRLCATVHATPVSLEIGRGTEGMSSK